MRACRLGGTVERLEQQGGEIYDGIRSIVFDGAGGYIPREYVYLYRNEEHKKIISPDSLGLADYFHPNKDV